MEIELLNICKSFKDNKVLNDLSFKAQSGQAFGLLGRNGSGKTTIIRIIMDIFKPDSGTVLFDGKQKKDTTLNFGYLPEERGLYPRQKVMDQMIYFANLKGMNTLDAINNSKNLLKKLDAEQYANKKLETLSKGNQQKIQLAIAIVNDPDVLILDEPFSGFDPINAKLLKDIVKEHIDKKKLVLFSSHQMSSVEEFCDDLCIINKGDLVLSGKLSKIKDEYPKLDILVVPNKNSVNSFNNILDDPILKSLINKVSDTKEGFVFNLKQEQNKNLLLNFLVSRIEVDNFTIVKPTLEQIFVEKAGDHIE